MKARVYQVGTPTVLLLTAILFLGCLSALPAAIGDNAPPLPDTYKTSHPRLPAPDSTFLDGLAKNSNALAAYNQTADAWDSKSPSGPYYLRRLLLAYMANKTANPDKAAAYLSKIKALADLGGTWGPLLYSVNDGVGNGTYTLTSQSANFVTGCGGGTCQGQILSINARTFVINSVTNANTVVLSASNPMPKGTNLPIRVFSGYGAAGISIAIIYDWLYNDLDTTTRSQFASQLDVLCTLWEEYYMGVGASPYNDVMYVRLDSSAFIGALAIYPDHPNGINHLRFMTDLWFNILMPVWRQVFGPEGGGWHESWSDYVNAQSGVGLNAYLVPSLLSWQTATGDQIFARESWLHNYGYWTMYMTRPDYIMESIGDTSRPYLNAEVSMLSTGSLRGLAEIYNDPVLRGWCRLVDGNFGDYEPTAWPYYKPDKSTNSVAPLSTLSSIRNFTGTGIVSMRTGWSENDTSATLKYGDNFWSHQHGDAGSFTIFSRGNLAIDSGSYRAAYGSLHHFEYARQTIAHNTLTVTDPVDYYPSTTFTVGDQSGALIQMAPVNDGGQRRVGSSYNERFPQLVSLNTIGDWMRNWDYYHMGTMVGFTSTENYTYSAVDITAAYNNRFSAGTPNASNRTNRVQKAVRHMLFIPRGTSAYVVVFDQVVSTDASFVKKWLLHSINQPTISGNRFEIVRNELAAALPYPDLWPQHFASVLQYDTPDFKYQYNGKLYGWMVLPQAGNINVVGGSGKEFWVEDPQKPGTGTNWNQCGAGYCSIDEGLGSADGSTLIPNPNTTPHEPGSWRIEVSPSSAATQDLFLHVMLATTAGDSSVPENVTVPSGLAEGTVGATWTEGGKTYTVTFPQSGVGGHVTISGVVDEDLASHAQRLPDTLAIVSGLGQSGAEGSALGSPFIVVVKDRAGNVLPNAAVHFGITQGSGRIVMNVPVTDSQGQASATLVPGPGTAGTVVKVMADVNGLQPIEFTVNVGAGSSTPTLTSVSCSPSTLTSGATSSCTVTLSQPAPSGGATVALSSNAAALTVPPSLTVAGQALTATFTATAGAISAGQSAVITGTLNGIGQTMTLTLAATPLTVTSISCAPTTLSSGATSACTVSLSQAAGSGGTTVGLSSNSALVTVPVSVVIPTGSSSALVTATAGSVASGQSAVITASLAGSSATSTLTFFSGASGGIPLTNGSWTMVRTSGLPVQTVGFEKLVYAPAPVKKAVMLGNYHQMGSEPNESLIAYDFETNRWSVLDMGTNFHTEYMPEGGHSSGGIAYNPNQNAFIYYCCNSGAMQPENPFFTWWYDPIGQAGRSKRTAPKPGQNGPPMPISSAFDASTNTFVLHGGYSFVGTWTYNPSTNTYQKQTPAGTAPDASVDFHAMTYDSADHKVYLFGGATPTGYSNDLFAYSVATNTWTKLNPAGSRPAPRRRMGFAFDSANNVFLLFGGEDATTVYTDTWIYDPVANTWSQLAPEQSPTPVGGPFEALAYDSDHNVFILELSGAGGYAEGQWSGYPLQTWLFRYRGAGPNPQTAPVTVTTTPGGLNRNFDGWAKEASLASSGATLYTGWTETGKPFDTSDATWFHTYISQYTGTGWVPMGGAPTSLDSEFHNYSESHSPSVAVVGGTPWISWYKTNNSSAGTLIWAKSWNGSVWQGGAIGLGGTDASRIFQGRSELTDIGGAPHIVFLENDKSFFPQKTLAYVKYWNGTTWTLKGGGPLNANASANTTATSISIASDGQNPYVAWTEYTSTYPSSGVVQTPGQVYVARWNGSQWVSVGNAINISADNTADDVAIAYFNAQPYVAWTERTTGGNNQLFVKTFNGTSWVLVGAGTLNKDTNTGWSYRPSLVADNSGDALYVGWVEQQALGARSQAYVSKFSAGVWTPLGGSLNADPILGSAQRISLAVTGGQPAAGWGEVNAGAARQIFVKKWNGSSWAALGGASKQVSCDVNGDGTVNVVDVQLAIRQSLGLASCTTSDLLQNGQCSLVDVNRVVTAALGGACVIGQ